MTQADFFLEIEKHWNKELPFVVFKKPNATLLKVQLQPSDKIESPNFNEEGFLFAPFVEGKQSSVWFSSKAAITLNSTFEKTEKLDDTTPISEVNLSEKETYTQKVLKAITVLKKGKLQKVVLSRKESIKEENISPLDYFLTICNYYPNTFCYCWFHPKIGMWLGATPETLVKLEENRFETMALAGTMPYNGSLEVNWGEKEREEQQYVVDSILDELKEVTNSIKKGTTQTQRAGSLLHLKTPIAGELNSVKGIQTLIELLHPTPAVCGLPKKDSKTYILNNENYDRKYYTGYLGEINPKETSHLFVNLRCMELERNQIHIYIGGGLTSLSDSEKEWEETTNKSQIMKRVL